MGPPSPATRAIIDHCNAYFREHPLDTWGYDGFLTHYAAIAPVVRGLAHSRYLKALEAIEDAASGPSPPAGAAARRQKARALIDQCRHQRRAVGSAKANTIVHGDVVHAAGDVIHAGGDVSINNTGRSTTSHTKRAAGNGNPPSAKRHASAPPAPTSSSGTRVTVSDGDVVHARGSVNINNTNRLSSHEGEEQNIPAAPASDDRAGQPSVARKVPLADHGRPAIKSTPQLVSFEARYKGMTKKHRLTSSGRLLEDHIYQSVRKTSNQSTLCGNPILQWVLDPQDPVVSGWFTNDEKAELFDSGPPLPPRDPIFEYAAARFPHEPASAGTLWDIIESPSRSTDESYDCRRHATATYVTSAAASILSMIEAYASSPTLGPEFLREGWFGHNLWGPLIDRCLQGIPRLLVSRTEIKSHASSQPNQRFDAVILAQLDLDELPSERASSFPHPPPPTSSSSSSSSPPLRNGYAHEFGAIEVARVMAATGPGKRAVDEGKLVTVLADMLAAVRHAVEAAPHAMKKLQVVGIQNVGFRIAVWTMHMVGDNVAVLCRGRSRTVPVAVAEFAKVLDVMRAVVRAKMIIQRSVETVVEWSEAKKRLCADEL